MVSYLCALPAFQDRFLFVFICQFALAVLQLMTQDVQGEDRRLACTHIHV